MFRYASLCFCIPLGVSMVCVGLLVALGSGGWPGEVGVSGIDFCEALRDEPIKQPANTWSNAAFYLAGLAIGWQSWRDVAARKASDWDNRFVTTVAYPASCATASVLIGTGSTALHASTTSWGAELDLLAMHLWGAWMIAFAATRLLRGPDRLFVALWTSMGALLAVRIALGHPLGIRGSDLFGLMVAAAIAVELIGRFRNRRLQRLDTPYLVWAVVTFLVAYACWRLSKNEGPWCDPSSWWQGHAVWHVLCAGSTVFVYLYGRSERRIGPRAEAI